MAVWQEKRLGEVAEIVSGGTPDTNNFEFWGGNIGWITPFDLSNYNYRYICNGTRNITDSGLANSSAKLLPSNTILFSSRAPIGYIAIAKNPLTTNQGFKNLICKNINYLFLYYYLKYNVNYLKLYATGATFPELSATTIKKIKINIPDLATQEKIADILSTYDDLIENNNRRIEILEQMAQEIYKEWFVSFRFPGHEKVKFVNGLPEGWEVKKIKDFGNIITGKTPSTEVYENYGKDIMFIKTPDMHDTVFTTYSSEYLSEKGHLTQANKLIPANSILVSCIGTAGIVSINAEAAHTNQQINSIVLNDENLLYWLFFSCRFLKNTIELYGATGATMTNLSKGKFENLKILMPKQELVYLYNNKVNNIFSHIKTLLYFNQNLIKQRDLLLPRLMSGKLEV